MGNEVITVDLRPKIFRDACDGFNAAFRNIEGLTLGRTQTEYTGPSIWNTYINLLVVTERGVFIEYHGIYNGQKVIVVTQLGHPQLDVTTSLSIEINHSHGLHYKTTSYVFNPNDEDCSGVHRAPSIQHKPPSELDTGYTKEDMENLLAVSQLIDNLTGNIPEKVTDIGFYTDS